MKTISFVLILILSAMAMPRFCSAQEERIDELVMIIDSTQSDSLKGASFYEMAFLSRLIDLELAHSYSDSGYFYFDKIGNDAGINLKSYLDATLAEIAGDYDQAIDLHQQHYDWAILENDLIRQTFALSGLAKSSREKGDLAHAVEYTLRGIEVQDSMGLSKENGFFYAELGDLYTKMHQWDKAKEYIQRSYDLAKETDFAIGQSFSLRNLASNSIERQNYEEAIDYIHQSIVIDSNNHYVNGLGKAHRDLGIVYERKSDLDKSMVHFSRALEYIEGTDNAFDFARIYQGMGRVLLRQNKISEAVENLELAKQYGRDLNALDFEVEQDLLRADLLERMGNFDEAYLAARSLLRKKDELLNQDIANRITGLHVAFETRQKEQEIELLNVEKEVAALRLEASNRRNIGFAIGLITLGIFAFFLLLLYRKIQSQHRIISKALGEKEILLREIHHRVKNNLQFVSSLLSLQSQHVVDKSAHAALTEGQNRVRSMALIHQKLYQEENLTGIAVKDYFENLTTNLFDSYNISRDRIELELDIQNVNLDVDTMIPLGLILNELVSNALKHAFKEED
ncbi:MAG: hypothetical protein OEQ53_10900, partial [Saprospiraceae bacterium]|nr:hypothetical protein [Saprospiraceae bacterium]